MNQVKHRSQQSSSRQPRKRGEEALQKCKNFRKALRQDILKDSRRRLNRIFDVDVKSIDTTSLSCSDILKEVKKWMEGPEVRGAFRRKGRRERVGGMMSFRLLKKLIPPPCKCLSSHYREEWSKGRDRGCEGELPAGFLDFCKKEVSKIFRPGWDRSYIDHVGKWQPKSSSCTSRGCSKGGSRAEMTVDRYVEALLADPVPLKEFSYQEVLTAGKVRPLTIAPVELNILRPMHKIIFEAIGRQKWSLIGPPTPEKLARAGFVFKDKILSGDYKGATDNLDLRVSSFLLKSILDTSTSIPDNHKDFALRSLNPTIKFDDGTHLNVAKGQMMGSLLSFPLLCLYNRVTSCYALGKVPMLINGDDLIAETRNPCRWFEVLPSLGLEPEKSKTGYSRSTFEINSTPFLVTKKGPVLAPVVRMGAFSGRPGVAAIGGGLTSFTHGLGRVTDRAAQEYMDFHKSKALLGISLGIPIEGLGFTGAIGFKYSMKYLFSRAWKLTQNFPLKNLPCVPSHFETSVRRVYSRPSADFRSDSDRRLLSEGLGRTIPKEDSRKAVSEWWDVARQNSTYLPSSSLCRERAIKMLGGCEPLRFKQPVPRYGELLSKAKFISRLQGSMLSTRSKHSTIHVDVFGSIPVLERWNIAARLA